MLRSISIDGARGNLVYHRLHVSYGYTTCHSRSILRIIDGKVVLGCVACHWLNPISCMNLDIRPRRNLVHNLVTSNQVYENILGPVGHLGQVYVTPVSNPKYLGHVECRPDPSLHSFINKISLKEFCFYFLVKPNFNCYKIVCLHYQNFVN